MKTLTKRLFRAIGYDIVRYIEMPISPFNVLELVVRKFLARYPDFHFVQIGAYDGVSGDPIQSIVLKYGLKGLLVEPQPDAFQQLKVNYSICTGLIFEQCAVAAQDGWATLYCVRDNAPVPAWAKQLASFNRAHLSYRATGIAKLEQYVEPFRVPTLTISSLLRRYGFSQIHLMQVDTEGHDFEIIKMAVESAILPKIINYEFVHLSRVDQASCKRLLHSCGYQFIDVGNDTLAILGNEESRS
jgi:FkbM family methyltransferase